MPQQSVGETQGASEQRECCGTSFHDKVWRVWDNVGEQKDPWNQDSTNIDLVLPPQR